MACRLAGAKPLSETKLYSVNSNLRSKLQWNLKRNSCVFLQENAFENVVYEMASILSRPQCVNGHMCIIFFTIRSPLYAVVLSSGQRKRVGRSLSLIPNETAFRPPGIICHWDHISFSGRGALEVNRLCYVKRYPDFASIVATIVAMQGCSSTCNI